MLESLRFHLRMYVTFQLVHLRTALAYEADFWIGILGVALTHGVGIVFVWTLFLRVPQVAGWSLWEVAALYALSIIPRGLTELLCDGQWQLRQLINRGEFDRLLVRSMSPALQVITQFSSIHGAGSIVLGSVVLGRALGELGLAWGRRELAAPGADTAQRHGGDERAELCDQLPGLLGLGVVEFLSVLDAESGRVYEVPAYTL